MTIKKLFLFLILPLVFIACSEDKTDSPTEPGASSTGSFSADVGTIKWDAEVVRAYKQANYTRIDGTQLLSDTQNKYSSIKIYLDILGLREPKLFGIGEDGNGLNYSAHAKVEATLRNGSEVQTFYGEYIENLSLLNVTYVDDRQVRGEFEFRGYTKETPTDSLNILNGSFNLKF